MPHLIVIGGPTASGKTALSIKLAQALNTIILSADSRQFYNEMRIGNARPEIEELAAAKHFFIADRSVTNPFSAGAFAREALELLEKQFKQYEYIIMVGGSGLYIDAVTEGLNEFPTVDEETRKKVEQLYSSSGLAGLQQAVEQADPDYFKEVDQQNPRRLQRALEVSWSTGKAYSSFKQEKTARFFKSHFFQPDLKGLPKEQFDLPKVQRSNTPSLERLNLYARIERRLDIMIEQGLIDEVKALYKHKELPSLQTVGYQEFFPFIEGNCSLTDALELAKRNSRRYAKRQLTWFNRDNKYKAVKNVAEILSSLGLAAQ